MADSDFQQGPFLDYARLTKVGSLVVNVEVVDKAWVDAHSDDLWFTFVPTPDREGNPAQIGLRFFPDTGLFEQPAVKKYEEVK